MGLGGAALLALAATRLWAGGGRPVAIAGPAFAGVWLLLNAATFIHTTRAGKFAVWDDLLASLKLKGDERHGAEATRVTSDLGTPDLAVDACVALTAPESQLLRVASRSRRPANPHDILGRPPGRRQVVAHGSVEDASHPLGRDGVMESPHWEHPRVRAGVDMRQGSPLTCVTRGDQGRILVDTQRAATQWCGIRMRAKMGP